MGEKSEEKINEMKKNFMERIKRVQDEKRISMSHIINMDETFIRLHNPIGYTLDVKGVKQVQVKSIQPKKGVTIILTIRGNGEMLDPFTIFKGIIIF